MTWLSKQRFLTNTYQISSRYLVSYTDITCSWILPSVSLGLKVESSWASCSPIRHQSKSRQMRDPVIDEKSHEMWNMYNASSDDWPHYLFFAQVEQKNLTILKLLWKASKFNWDNTCEEAFQMIKMVVASTAVLESRK